jgi:hypothetical protein
MHDAIPQARARRPWQYKLRTLFVALLVAGIALEIEELSDAGNVDRTRGDASAPCGRRGTG